MLFDLQAKRIVGKLFRIFSSRNLHLRSEMANACMPRNVNSMERVEFQRWLDSFDVVLFDCDGVIWFLHKILDIFKGCDEVVNKFMEMGKKVYFLTNNSMVSRAGQVSKARELGFHINDGNVITTGFLAAEYLKRANFKKTAYVIGMSGITKELDMAGIKNYGEGPDPVLSSMPNLYVSDIKQDPEIGAVIVGNDVHLSLTKLGRAATFLTNNPDTLLLCTKPEVKFSAVGVTVPFPGAIVKTLEIATNKKSELLGKPSDFLATVLYEIEADVPRDRFLMIGDTIDTDVIFGNKNGMQTMMVGTGASSLKDVEAIVESLNVGKEDALEFKVPKYYIPKLIDLLVENENGCKL